MKPACCARTARRCDGARLVGWLAGLWGEGRGGWGGWVGWGGRAGGRAGRCWAAGEGRAGGWECQELFFLSCALLPRSLCTRGSLTGRAGHAKQPGEFTTCMPCLIHSHTVLFPPTRSHCVFNLLHQICLRSITHFWPVIAGLHPLGAPAVRIDEGAVAALRGVGGRLVCRDGGQAAGELRWNLT